MAKIVIFTEKEDVAKHIANYLGNTVRGKGYITATNKGQEYQVTWAMGHLVTLRDCVEYDPKYKKWSADLYPFIPNPYQLKVIDSKKRQYDVVRALFTAKDTTEIWNAGDIDREGELIFDLIYEMSGSKKPLRRVWLSSYTDEAIGKALREFYPLDKSKLSATAGRCRSMADWLIGVNVTVLATIKYGGYQNLISQGRVQTPTLGILVARELEIRSFKAEKYYEVEAILAKGDSQFKGKWSNGNGKVSKIKNKADAEAIVARTKGKQGAVVKYEQTTTSEAPPLLYDLAALQGKANAKYGYSATETLELAQFLYMNKYTTYPRGESRYLSEDLKSEIPKILKSVQGTAKEYADQILADGITYTKRVFDNSKVGAHYAIIPTGQIPKGLDKKQQNVFDLVMNSVIKAFMPNATWSNVKIETDIEKEVFLSSGRTLMEIGWRAVEDSKVEEDTGEDNQLLPVLINGDGLLNKSTKAIEKSTTAPKRYTEKMLIEAMKTAGKLVEDEELADAMKDHGIGTPATRAAIIEKLVNVNYIERKGKSLIPTEKGVAVIQHLPTEALKSPQMTGEWEYLLNQIAEGKYDPQKFMADIEQFTIASCDDLKNISMQKGISTMANSIGKCPNEKCGGDIVETTKGFGCSNWKEENGGCKFVIWKDMSGKNISESQAKLLLEKGKTGVIKGFVSRTKGTEFDAALIIEDNGNGGKKVGFEFSDKK